jgi:hypothetical protein
MDKAKFVWTALPPLPLRGLNSELVESIDHYILRMSWITGLSVSQLMSVLHGGNFRQRSQSSLRFYRLDAPSELRLFALERLTGVEQLRHGTLWVMKDVFNTRALEGAGVIGRRWCPRCYKDWDREESWEPLVWAIPYVFRCPIHQCTLISECTSCGAEQSPGVAIDRRRSCQKCGAELGGDGAFVDVPRFYDWVDAQICSLVKFCATVGRKPLSIDTLALLTRKLRGDSRFKKDVTRLRKCLGKSQPRMEFEGITLKALINLGALYGRPVVDMVLCPREAMSTPLLDIWSGFHWLSDPFARKDDRVRAARWLLKRLLSHSELLYLPAMRVLARDVGVSPSRLRGFDPEIYGRYMDAYQNQQSPVVRYARGHAFAIARGYLKDMDPSRWWRTRLWWLPRDVRRDARVSFDDASCACCSAIIYTRLLTRVLKHIERCVAAKEDIRWLESSPTAASS